MIFDILICLLFVAMGYIIGSIHKIVIVKDKVKLNPNRNSDQQLQDIIMQLKNEIADSGCIHFEYDKKTEEIYAYLKLQK